MFYKRIDMIVFIFFSNQSQNIIRRKITLKTKNYHQRKVDIYYSSPSVVRQSESSKSQAVGPGLIQWAVAERFQLETERQISAKCQKVQVGVGSQ